MSGITAFGKGLSDADSHGGSSFSGKIHDGHFGGAPNIQIRLEQRAQRIHRAWWYKVTISRPVF